MKKFLSIVLALMLCLSAVAVAESVPSVTMDSLVKMGITPADTGILIEVLDQEVEQTEEYQRLLQISDVELAKLAEIVKNGENATAYFSKMYDAERYFAENFDAEQDVKDLSKDVLTVAEFWPMVVKGATESMGDISVNMLFPVLFEKDAEVYVLFGIVTMAETVANEEGLKPEDVENVDWIAVKADVLEDGSIQLALTEELAMLLQKNDVLAAVVTRTDAPEAEEENAPV